MIEIERLNNSHTNHVLNVKVAEEQLKYAGTAKEFLSDASETCHLHIIKQSNDIIGFLKLDISYSSNFPFCPVDGIGLRFFVIDEKHQGKGFGIKAAKALPKFLIKNYPNFNSIYLTVNAQNLIAQKCYAKAGFKLAQGQIEGPSGIQYIMYLNFKATK